MERRELLSLGGIAAIAGALGASAAEEPAGGKRILRIYADPEGNSHIQELPIATKPGKTRRTEMAAATGLLYADYTASSVEDWHRTPGRQFSISMSGEIEVEVSGGKKHAIQRVTSCSSRTCKARDTSRAFYRPSPISSSACPTALMSSSGRAAKLDIAGPLSTHWRRTFQLERTLVSRSARLRAGRDCRCFPDRCCRRRKACRLGHPGGQRLLVADPIHHADGDDHHWRLCGGVHTFGPTWHAEVGQCSPKPAAGHHAGRGLLFLDRSPFLGHEPDHQRNVRPATLPAHQGTRLSSGGRRCLCRRSHRVGARDFVVRRDADGHQDLAAA